MRNITKYDKCLDIQSSVISWLRFPLTVLVVYIHSYGLPPQHADIPVVYSGVYEITRVVVSNMIAQLAVPSFFFISGFLMFLNIDRFSKGVYTYKIRRRFYTLLIPYVLWNIIALIVWFVRIIRSGISLHDTLTIYIDKGIFSFLWKFYTVGGATTDWFGNDTYMTVPADLPFWYLRDLIVITFLSPIIYYCIKKFRIYMIVILGLLYCSAVWQYAIVGLSTVAFFYYSMGAYFSIVKIDFVSFFRKTSLPTFILYPFLLIFVLFCPQLNVWLLPFFRLVGVCFAFAIADVIVRKRMVNIPPVLEESTFFIYAVHYIFFLSICDDLIGMIFPVDNDITHAIQYLLSPLFRICIYILIFILFNKFFPRLSKILVGNRVLRKD